MRDDELEAAKAELRQALDVILPSMEPGGSFHNACACMGPLEGRNLCPCEEKAVARDYLKQWRSMLDFVPPYMRKPTGATHD